MDVTISNLSNDYILSFIKEYYNINVFTRQDKNYDSDDELYHRYPKIFIPNYFDIEENLIYLIERKIEKFSLTINRYNNVIKPPHHYINWFPINKTYYEKRIYNHNLIDTNYASDDCLIIWPKYRFTMNKLENKLNTQRTNLHHCKKFDYISNTTFRILKDKTLKYPILVYKNFDTPCITNHRSHVYNFLTYVDDNFIKSYTKTLKYGYFIYSLIIHFMKVNKLYIMGDFIINVLTKRKLNNINFFQLKSVLSVTKEQIRDSIKKIFLLMYNNIYELKIDEKIYSVDSNIDKDKITQDLSCKSEFTQNQKCNTVTYSYDIFINNEKILNINVSFINHNSIFAIDFLQNSLIFEYNNYNNKIIISNHYSRYTGFDKNINLLQYIKKIIMEYYSINIKRNDIKDIILSFMDVGTLFNLSMIISILKNNELYFTHDICKLNDKHKKIAMLNRINKFTNKNYKIINTGCCLNNCILV